MEENIKDGLVLDEPDTDVAEDLKIENNALKELLTEHKATMDALREELKTVKTTNAKLLNQLSVKEEKPTLEAMLNSFNKYKN